MPWHPTPVLLPGKSHGQRSPVGCSPWGCEELDTTELLHFHFLLSCTGEGNGNPLQCSCLENPRDGGVWWATIYGVAQGWTQQKRLSSSSSSRAEPGTEGVYIQMLMVIMLCYYAMPMLTHFSCVWLFATPWTVAHQGPPSMGFPRQEYWSGLPFPSPMHESKKWKWSSSVESDSYRPLDCCLPGSSVHGIFQARVLEWVAIAFSEWCSC